MAKQHLDETQHPESIILRDPSVEVNSQATSYETQHPESIILHDSSVEVKQPSNILARLNIQLRDLWLYLVTYT